MPTRGAASDYVRAANQLLKPGGVFVFVETSRKEAVAAIIRCLDTDAPRLKVQARIRVVTRCAANNTDTGTNDCTDTDTYSHTHTHSHLH